MAIEDFGSRLALDARGLDDLKARATTDPRAALKGAAQQFEAYFMQTMLKSMRDTLSQDSMFDSDQTRFYTSMFDQQLGQNLAGSGSMGLAQVLERQLSGGRVETSAAAALGPRTSLPVGEALRGQRPLPAEVERVLRQLQAVPASADARRGDVPGLFLGDSLRLSHGDSLRSQKNPANAALPVPAAVSAGSAGSVDAPREFVATVWPHAVEASATTGLPPHLLVAHAALESGWGKSEPRLADGSPSYNLFGVKAGKRWAGATVDTATTEFVNGQAQARVEKFRAYGSYQEAFADYAQLLSSSPRFSSVVAANNGTDFANSLQQSGYATDPMYAAKLSRIIQGKTLRDALQG